MDALRSATQRAFAGKLSVMAHAALFGGIGGACVRMLADQLKLTADSVHDDLKPFEVLIEHEASVACALDEVLGIVRVFCPRLIPVVLSLARNLEDLLVCVLETERPSIATDLSLVAHVLSSRASREISDICAHFPVLAPSRGKLEERLQEIFESQKSMNDHVRVLERERPLMLNY